MDTILALLPSSLWALGVCIALAVIADRFIKLSIKRTIIDKLFHRDVEISNTIASETAWYFRVLTKLYRPNNLSTFVIRSSIISLLSIVLLSLFQFNFNYKAFNVITFPYFKSLTQFHPFEIYMLICLLIIDFICANFTLVFLRIAAHCKNIVEIIFLFISNALMSVTMFIVFFPGFMAGFFVLHTPDQGKIDFVLSTQAFSNSYNFENSILSLLVFEPRFFNQSGSNAPLSSKDDSNSTHLSTVSLSVSAYPKISDRSASLENAPNEMYTFAKIAIQITDNLDFKYVFEQLPLLLNATGYVSDTKLNEYYSGFMSQYGLFSATPHVSISPSNVFLIYRDAIQDVSFFNNNFVDVITLGDYSASIRNLYGSDAFFSALKFTLGTSQTGVVSCDGKTKKIEASSATGSFESEATYFKNNCKTVIAIMDIFAAQIARISMYQRSNSAQIPISVFAMSSLTATVIIYYFLILRLFVSFTFRIISSVVENAYTFVEWNIFTILTTSFVIAFAPLYIIIRQIVISP